jgi:hypothetical protein
MHAPRESSCILVWAVIKMAHNKKGSAGGRCYFVVALLAVVVSAIGSYMSYRTAYLIPQLHPQPSALLVSTSVDAQSSTSVPFFDFDGDLKDFEKTRSDRARKLSEAVQFKTVWRRSQAERQREGTDGHFDRFREWLKTTFPLSHK